MKRNVFIPCLVALCLIVSFFPISARAEETLCDVGIVAVSEYEYITEIQDMSETELTSMGLTNGEIEYLKDFDIEEELLRRKEQTNEVLRNAYGYSDEQIAILREYTGDSIEDNPELCALLAELTFSIPSVIRASATEVAVNIQWSWSSKPLLILPSMSDTIAVMWQGTYGSDSGNIRMNTSSSYWMANYLIETNTITNHMEVYHFSTTAPTASAKVSYPTNYGSGYFAMNGLMSLYFDTTEGSADLTSFDLLIVYGRSTVVGTASISIESGFDYTLSVGTSEEAVVSGYINISDKTWRYN